MVRLSLEEWSPPMFYHVNNDIARQKFRLVSLQWQYGPYCQSKGRETLHLRVNEP